VSTTRRREEIRIAIRALIRTGHIARGKRTGAQMRLAEHFGVTRQRIGQLARQELGRCSQ
jgi:DNA-binding FadR family transcriptional regulator